MNHRFIILGISLFIIVAIVSGVVYFEWPERPPFQQSLTTPTSTVDSLPIPAVGPPPAGGTPSVVTNEQYTRLDLADVESYAAKPGNNFVVTSGTVVGIKLTPFYQLVLGDGKDNYVLVTFARVDTDQFAPIFSSLRIGDTVEVMGRTRLVQGVLVSSQDGMAIEMVGVNLANAPYFGAISLAGITKIE